MKELSIGWHRTFKRFYIVPNIGISDLQKDKNWITLSKIPHFWENKIEFSSSYYINEMFQAD